MLLPDRCVHILSCLLVARPCNENLLRPDARVTRMLEVGVTRSLKPDAGLLAITIMSITMLEGASSKVKVNS